MSSSVHSEIKPSWLRMQPLLSWYVMWSFCGPAVHLPWNFRTIVSVQLGRLFDGGVWWSEAAVVKFLAQWWNKKCHPVVTKARRTCSTFQRETTSNHKNRYHSCSSFIWGDLIRRLQLNLDNKDRNHKTFCLEAHSVFLNLYPVLLSWRPFGNISCSWLISKEDGSRTGHMCDLLSVLWSLLLNRLWDITLSLCLLGRAVIYQGGCKILIVLNSADVFLWFLLKTCRQ